MVKRFYKAQALALVMVVLVVASIIGISLFSRMSKDTQSAISQQDSALAEEQADAILDIFIGADILALESALEGDGIGPFNTIAEMKESLDDIDDIGVDTTALPDEEWCESEKNSSIVVSLEQTDSDDYIEVQPGGVRAYNLEDVVPADPCDLRLRLRAMSDYAVFLVKFVSNDGSIVSESNEQYCIPNDNSVNCGDIERVEYESSLTDDMVWDSDRDAYIKDINLVEMVGNNIVEIRVIPMYGTLAVSNYFDVGQQGCIDKEFRAVKIRAEVTCTGAYRGKEMYLPGSGNWGYSTLFDYAIYDNGLFRP